MRTISPGLTPLPNKQAARAQRSCDAVSELLASKAQLTRKPFTEVSRVHADLNRIGGLLKLAIREGMSDRSSYSRLNLELSDSIIQVRRAVNRLAGQR